MKRQANVSQNPIKRWLALERIAIYKVVDESTDLHLGKGGSDQIGWIEKGQKFTGTYKMIPKKGGGVWPAIMLNSKSLVPAYNKEKKKVVKQITDANDPSDDNYSGFINTQGPVTKIVFGGAVGAGLGLAIASIANKHIGYWALGGGIIGAVATAVLQEGGKESHSNIVSGSYCCPTGTLQGDRCVHIDPSTGAKTYTSAKICNIKSSGSKFKGVLKNWFKKKPSASSSNFDADAFKVISLKEAGK